MEEVRLEQMEGVLNDLIMSAIAVEDFLEEVGHAEVA